MKHSLWVKLPNDSLTPINMRFLQTLALVLLSTPLLAADVERAYFIESADQLLVEYDLHHELVANDDRDPMLRVFGDGVVKVHIPSYMKRAGQWQMQLTSGELQDLIEGLIRDGLMAYSDKATKNLERASARAGEFHAISDETVSDIVLNLYALKLRTSDDIYPVGGRRLRLANVSARAKHRPGLAPLVALKKVEARLDKLIKSPRLMRLP